MQAAGDAHRLAQSKSQGGSTRQRGDLQPKPHNRALGSATVSSYDFQRAKPFISAIPRGRWSAYKDVATAAGNPDAYMAAGNDLRASNGTIDGYWRVIHSDGGIADGFVAHAVNQPRDPESARARLQSEGIRFDHRGRADKSQRFTYQDLVRSR
jgi:alkylated DNA nucleotide flippase Atl1